MDVETAETLPAELELALAYTPAKLRGRLEAFFALDQRLARIVAATTEPMLGQMRLAWWRDMLGSEAQERPRGDAVLDAIGEHWPDDAGALVAVVDGWEHLLSDPPLTEADASQFAEGRCAPLLAVFTADNSRDGQSANRVAAWRWAVGDLAANVTLDAERALLLTLGMTDQNNRRRLTRDCRGLAILGALATRSLKRGGRPLMEGRMAAMIALRAALIRC